MVDLSGGQDGPLEHAFSNSVFIIPGIVVVSLTDVMCFTLPIDVYNTQRIAVVLLMLKRRNMEVTVDQNAAGGGLGSQIGSAITSKLKESIQNMDVMGLLHNLVASTPEDAESEEIRQKLQNVIKLYTDMSEEEKEQFTTQLKEALVTKLQRQVKETPIDLSGLDQAIASEIMFKLALYGIGALLLLALIVFFGYKLYKSIKDKEKKREDKKKAKQMKKKK